LVFFDTNVLWNFAVVGRLDILEKLYAGRCHWTVSVYDEAWESKRHEAALADLFEQGWLPEPTEVPVGEYPEVFKLRRAIGSVLAKTLEHMGEAETLHVIQTQHPGAQFLSDDRPATHMARQRKIAAGDTVHVMRQAFVVGITGCPDSYELLKEMRAHGRWGVRIQADHSYVC
jgi:predicted nucleic acid-binding protein